MKDYPWPVCDFSTWLEEPSGDRCGIDAVLFGAGISVPTPTSAPSGAELAIVAAKTLLESSGAADTAGLIDTAEARAEATRLRLETVMQTWWDITESAALFATYNLLKPLPANDNHHLLAGLFDVDLLTVNMDTCVDKAAECLRTLPRVQHLHGRCQDLKSIITTIEGYERGLPPAVVRRVHRSFAGRHVWVMGYSGQDIDVVPQLQAAPPKTLTWVQYNPEEDLSVEAESVLMRLWREKRNVRVVTGDPDLYLGELLASQGVTVTCNERCGGNPPDSSGSPDSSDSSDSDDSSVESRLAAHPRATRIIAAATVLAGLGMWEEAAHHLNEVPPTGEASALAEKLQGRFLRLAGRPTEAISVLGWPPVTPARWRRFKNAPNEALAAALEARSSPALAWHALLAHVPQQAPLTARGEILIRSVRSRYAQHLNMRGRFAAAERLAGAEIPAINSKTFGQAASQTAYHVDILKARGRYTEALLKLRELDDWVTYLAVHTQADFRWKRGEVLWLAGDKAAAIDDLRWVADATPSSASAEQSLWHAATSIASWPSDSDLADDVANRASRAHRLTPAVRAFAWFALCERFISLEQAGPARDCLVRAETVISGSGRLWRLPTYELTLAYLSARADGAAPSASAARRLVRLQREFARVDMMSMAMRCALLAVRHGVPAPPGAAEFSRRHRWHAEELLATSTGRGGYLPLVL